ncbi:helix-turn-helix transcriptional regulator [Paenibacillus sp. IB182496]|uniref:Helix-turn-helix transcriptional regulator n=2 Tax=Paenibacillus sabuli TaxID=2772509 RepID=A0A927C078_9BACL|nr:helix-turn-helix transcriptional regulator [Paenibacillus sabuli]
MAAMVEEQAAARPLRRQLMTLQLRELLIRSQRERLAAAHVQGAAAHAGSAATGSAHPERLGRADDGRRRDGDTSAAGQAAAPRPVQRPDAAIWPIIAHIHLHYRDELSLGALAARFGRSPSRLSMAIKRHAGLTFTQLLHEVRVRHACGLLATTAMPTVEVAAEVGFSSYKTFARVFRDRKGETPGDYRSRMRSLRA